MKKKKGEGKRKKYKAKGRRNPTQNLPPCGCKIDFSGRGGGNNMIHLHNIYACVLPSFLALSLSNRLHQLCLFVCLCVSFFCLHDYINLSGSVLSRDEDPDGNVDFQPAGSGSINFFHWIRILPVTTDL